LIAIPLLLVIVPVFGLRNAAADIAPGEILVFIDSDETAQADSLSRIATAS
jgi:hypothetical protein